MKTSRAITSSFSWSFISGPTGRPALDSWEASASTRAFGTGLPLTTATFCANAGSATHREAAASAARRCFFMGVVPLGVERKAIRKRYASRRFDGQRMHAAVQKIAQRIIHKAMPAQP
jgi:hypothetical protein